MNSVASVQPTTRISDASKARSLSKWYLSTVAAAPEREQCNRMMTQSPRESALQQTNDTQILSVTPIRAAHEDKKVSSLKKLKRLASPSRYRSLKAKTTAAMNVIPASKPHETVSRLSPANLDIARGEATEGKFKDKIKPRNAKQKAATCPKMRMRAFHAGADKPLTKRATGAASSAANSFATKKCVFIFSSTNFD